MDEGATLVVPGYHLAALRSAGVKKRTTAAMVAGLHLFLLKGLLPAWHCGVSRGSVAFRRAGTRFKVS
jgi:hypothetical protein